MRVEEMDKKIDELIKKTSQYKSDYFKVDRIKRDLEMENDALKQKMLNAEGSMKGMNAILKTTERMLELTKGQYSETVEDNVMIRRNLNDLYNICISPDIT